MFLKISHQKLPRFNLNYTFWNVCKTPLKLTKSLLQNSFGTFNNYHRILQNSFGTFNNYHRILQNSFGTFNNYHRRDKNTVTIKFRRSGVPTRDSFSRRILKASNLGRVEAWYLKPKIVFSRSTNTSSVRNRLNTWISDSMGVWYSNGKVMWLVGPF